MATYNITLRNYKKNSKKASISQSKQAKVKYQQNSQVSHTVNTIIQQHYCIPHVPFWCSPQVQTMMTRSASQTAVTNADESGDRNGKTVIK